MTLPILFDIPKSIGFAETEEILKSKEMVQGDALEGGRVPHLPDIITSIDGPRHMARRRMYTALFRPIQLALYEKGILLDALRREFDAASASAGETGDGGTTIRIPDLPMVIRSAVVRVSAKLIGLDLPDEAAVGELVRHSRNIADGRDQVWAMEPSDEAIARARLTWDEFLRDFHIPSRQRRADRLARGEVNPDEPLDLITLLLRDGPDEMRTDPGMACEVGLFLTASVNTTAAAAPKAAEALARWLLAHPEDRDRLDDESFLRLAAQEALRLYPTVPFLVREASTDLSLSSGRVLRKGDLIRADISGANRDPAFFGADPDIFNPWRKIAAPRLFGLSFGAGPHLCMGREMVTGRPTPHGGSGPDGAVGLVVGVLEELYRRGLTLDPQNPPRLAEGTSQHKYAAFPAIFTKAQGRN